MKLVIGNIGYIGGIGCGIYLGSSTNITITQNTIQDNQGGQGGMGSGGGAGGRGGIGCGIYLYYSTNNLISLNTIFNNKGGYGGPGFYSIGKGGIGCGIYYHSSTNNTFTQNTISESQGNRDSNSWGGVYYPVGYGIYIDNNSHSNIIESNNTYNGESIFYYYGMSGITIEGQNLTLAGSGSTNLGRIVVINCQNFTIRNNTISGGIGENGDANGYTGEMGCGVYLYLCTNTIITKNTISNNKGGQGGMGSAWHGIGGVGGIGCGIYFYSCTQTTITQNTISNNTGGQGGSGGEGNPGGGGWGPGGVGGIGCGIYLYSSTQTTITQNTSNNTGGRGGIPATWAGSYGPGQGYGMYVVFNSNPELHYNNLSGNKSGVYPNGTGETKGYGVYTDGTAGTISATFNWWGDTSGPSGTGSGSGDMVSSYVDYTPWLSAPLANITFTPISGAVGTLITISGEGFGKTETIRIDFGLTLTITTTISNASGKFSTTFTVDLQSIGTTTVKATGVTSTSVATAMFNILKGGPTYVSGTITQNTTWLKYFDPYIVTNDVTIAEGVSLTIEPDVIVKFATDTSLIAYGKLIAMGTLQATITFTSNLGTTSSWNSIKFSGSPSKGTISRCVIEYGKQGIYLDNASGIVITDNIIRYNKGKDGAPGDYDKKGNTGEIGAGIYLISSNNNTIEKNTVSNNRGGDGGRAGTVTNTYEAGGEGGRGSGIYLLQSMNNMIRENAIYNNNGGKGGKGSANEGSGGNGGNGCGIYLQNSKENIIEDNTISESQSGEEGSGQGNGLWGCRGISAGIYLGSNSITNNIERNPINNSNSIVGRGIYGIYIEEDSLNNIIPTTNTYKGEKTHYYYNQSGIIIENQQLTGSATTNYGKITLIQCSDFTIKNNIIQGGKGVNGVTKHHSSGEKGKTGAGIYLLSCDNSRIISNEISDNTGGYGDFRKGSNYGSGGGGIGAGIYIGSSTNCVITDNKFYNNKGGGGGHARGGEPGSEGGDGVGIYSISSSNNIIGTNTVMDNKGGEGANADGYTYGGLGGIGGGIFLLFSSNNVIRANILSNFTGGNGGNTGWGTQQTGGGSGGNGAGICILSSLNNIVKGNNISKCNGGNGGGGYYCGQAPGGAGIGIFTSLSNESNSENIIFNNSGGSVNGKGIGIWCESSSPTVMETTIGTGSTYGLYCTGSSSPTIGSTTIFNNLYGIYISSLSNPIIHNSQIYNNLNYGIYKEGTTTIVDAKDNWWGNETGPNDNSTGAPDYNPYGTGDKVTDYVAYRPWKGLGWITILPTSGTVGTIVTIQGVSYRATESVQIDFGITQTITTVTTDSSGNFTTIFTVNTQLSGVTTIKATGLSNQMYAEATFFILPNIIFISPIMGTVGTSVNIMGNGFGATESICISFGTTRTIQVTNTSAQGSFTTAFTVDTQSFGTTTIRVRGGYTATEDMDYFFIVPNIISVNPYEGTVGTSVTIAGNGFRRMENIRIDFGTTADINNVVSSACGSFSAVFMVNLQPYGTTSILASGLVTNSRAFAVFKIAPNITSVSPASGLVGSLIAVTGNGFAPTELVRIDFGTTPTIASTAANAKGEFHVTFTTDSQPIGTTTITAYGMQTGAFARALFIILPPTTLKITPASQNISVGTEFISQVEIMDVRRMVTAKIHLSFNPNVLELQGIGTGTFPTGGMVVKLYDNGTGKIDYFVGLLSGSATGSGVLCTLKFKAKAGGTSAVVFDFETDRMTRLKDIDDNNNYNNIPFNKEEALYRVITGIEVKPKDKVIKADERIEYQAVAHCGSVELDVTGSTTFTATGGGSFTTNTFLAKYIGTYTIAGEYLGFIGTTAVIIIPGTPTTLVYVSGNNQVNTCTLTLKEPFIVKVVDIYGNPCPDVEVNWEIINVPAGAGSTSISSTRTTTNIQGIASSSLTLGTEPPGTYTIHAISTGLSGSPYTFTAHSLRRFGNIDGFCFLDYGTRLGTCSQIQVTIIQTGQTITTNESSYFRFETIPVGSYTLYFDTAGAAPKEIAGVCIGSKQFENTTYIGTVTLLAGDVNNDGKVNIEDWPGFIDAFFKHAGTSSWEEAQNADFNHDGIVDDDDFIIFRENFGEGKGKGIQKAKSLKPTSGGRIELSFNLETLEGVDINDLRIGNIIYLKVSIRDAKNFLGGEVHLSFNPNVLEVVNTPIPSPIKSISMMNMKRIPTNEEIRIQPGTYTSGESWELMNKVDNSAGKIDYAVGVFKPQTTEEGILAIVPFRIKACGASSKIEFDLDQEDNRETMFIERTQGEEGKPVDVKPEVLPDEVIINVPKVFNNLDSALVYPNPARKGETMVFDNLISGKPISLKIFNIAGELIFEDEKTPIGNKISWNLRNKDNEYVASGIYIYLLNDHAGSIKKGKIGVIK